MTDTPDREASRDEKPAVDFAHVRDLTRQAVLAAVAPADMTVRKIRPESTLGFPEPRPLAGLRAAQAVARYAEVQAAEFVKVLRAEGTTWADVVDLLEIPWSPDYVQSERAFEVVARGAGSSYSGDLRLYWSCAGPDGCGQSIVDYGPYNGYPSDCESGHADGCRRHAAERAAFERHLEEREHRADVMDEALAEVKRTHGEHSFAAATVDRARWVQDHGGRWLGWSTSESLAVALVLDDAEQLAAHGYRTREAALDRVFPTAAGRPTDVEAWLVLVRAAATGRR